MSNTQAQSALSLTRPTTLPNQLKKVQAPAWLHFFAGGLGGMIGALFTSPLDVLKTRQQSSIYKPSDVKTTSVRNPLSPFVDTWRMLTELRKQEGVRAYFKGLGPNLVGVIPARAINFCAYGTSKRYISEWTGESSSSWRITLASAVIAGLATATATNPIWMVKTRLQLHSSTEYRNAFDCLRKIVKDEGFRALYKGLGASYLGINFLNFSYALKLIVPRNY
eukprot:TRINITY_DN551_c0_g1_i1.p1 TRINITY_DN551_c0_g1~~TRINITY_DN551_c0_g1_i1.p1  ORF type:complete len:222 (-),score=-11.50 TRINITY_DN551_c0_g1_i1:379-1044(-)